MNKDVIDSTDNSYLSPISCSTQQQAAIGKLTKELASLKEENAQLNRELQEITEYSATLESRVGRGEFDTTKSKV